MEVCEEYRALESEVDCRLRADGMDDDVFSNLWMARMRKIPDMNKKFRTLLHTCPEPTLPDGQVVDAYELDEVTEWIANQFACAFAKKIAMGERYTQEGMRPLRNTGYQMGSSLVEIVNQQALAHLSQLPTYHEDTLMTAGHLGNARALAYLGRIVRNITTAAMVMEPKDEDLIEPFILKIEPQPTRMRPEKRTPENVVEAVWTQPLEAANWAQPELRANVALRRALRDGEPSLTAEERLQRALDAAARYQGI